MPGAEIPQEEGETSEQKRFIRTFAADMAAVQAGDTPDLRLLQSDSDATTEMVPVPKEEVTASSVPDQIPVPPPLPPIQAALSPETEQENKQAILARLRAKAAASANAPTAQPAASTPEPLGAAPLHTYSSDFSEKVRNTHASTASILAAQQDAGPGSATPYSSERSRGGIVFILSGVVLLFLGGTSAYVGYQVYKNRSLPVIITPTVSAPIFVNERAEISGTSTALAREIVQSVATPLAGDGVRFLYTETSTSTDQSIFSALQLPAPGLLVRNINAEGSMAGVIQIRGTPSVFFILAVQSYSDTFAGMLSWENTMPRDLAELFPSYPTNHIVNPLEATTTAPSMISTSTPGDTEDFTLVYKAGFFDEVVASHDARAYHDTTGETVFLYSYANPSTLILARNEDALTEILSRINTSRSK